MSASPAPEVKGRLTSLDAYRGFVMFLMMAEVLAFCAVSRAIPESFSGDFSAITSRTSNGSVVRFTT